MTTRAHHRPRPGAELNRLTAPGWTHALYEGTVTHTRHLQIQRTFTHRVFLAHLVLDDLESATAASPWFSTRGGFPLRFDPLDHHDGSTEELAPAIRAMAGDALGTTLHGPVTLLAYVRTLGWNFNPLAVYWCWNPSGERAEAMVLEVTNTPWRERTAYIIDLRHQPSAGPWRDVFAKHLHVSPFLPPDVDHHLTTTPPGDDLRLTIQDRRNDERILTATLDLTRRPFDRRTLSDLARRHPLLPQRTTFGIWAHALVILLRGVRYRSHPPGGRIRTAVTPQDLTP